MVKYISQKSITPTPAIGESAIDYTRRAPDAHAGNNGHGTTLGVLRRLRRLSKTEAEFREAASYYRANKCHPDWSDTEWQHKLAESSECDAPVAAGNLPVKFRCSPVPVAIDDGVEEMQAWIDHIYREEETLFISGGMSHDKFLGKGWDIESVSDLIANDPEAQWLLGNKKDGLYIKVNPIKADWKDTPSQADRKGPTEWFETPKTGSGDWASDVERFDNCLVEFDMGSIDDQQEIIANAMLPVRAQCLSGSKSLHSVIAIDAGQDRGLYRARTAKVVEAIQHSIAELQLPIKIAPDKVQDAVRWMRFGGATRLQDKDGNPLGENGEGVIQRIIGLWQARWEEPIAHNPLADELIACARTAAQSINDPITAPPEIMQGIFRAGDIVSLTASSKIGKTWELLRASHAIASGGKWLGIQCFNARVLYLNFELHDYDMDRRINTIFGDIHAGIENITILNLRGKQGDADGIMTALSHLTDTQQIDPDVVVVDPIYRFYGDADENSNTDIANLLLRIVRFAKSINAAVLYAHHHAKGRNRQETMKAGEQQSGAGAFTRNYDANLNISPAKVSDAPPETSILEFDLRNFKSREPIHIRWDTEQCAMTEVSQEEIDKYKTGLDEEQEQRQQEREDYCQSCLADWQHFWRDFGGGSRKDLIAYLESRVDQADDLMVGKDYKDPLDTSPADWAKKLADNIKRKPDHFAIAKEKTGARSSIYLPVE